MSSYLAGLGLGLSLIVAIGAQNAFVLREGIRRQHVGLVAAICTISDWVLICVGIAGIGVATQVVPWLVPVVRWAGAAFLIGYGLLALRRALRPSGQGLQARAEPADQPLDAAGGGRVAAARPATSAAVAATTLALTWLNPHVFLDTVFLLGSVGAAHGDQRWIFATGAMTASALWFFGLAYGARLLGRWLRTPRSWQFLDGGIALVMVWLGVSLVV